MAPLALTDTLLIKSANIRIPQLGFGVWDSPPDLCRTSCINAICAGYRHIDTAQIYFNEVEVGRAVAECGYPREDLFITTKINDAGADADASYQKCLDSIGKLDGREGGGGGYVDLFLIHNTSMGPDNCRQAWGVLERLYAEGRAKAIGVSNFAPRHMEEMRAYAKVWPPHVNQIELHPWNQQRANVRYCEENGIVIEAYCPIVRNKRADNPTLVRVAEGLGVTPNQILLRYSLQKGWVPLPKSDDRDRMRRNADLYGFEIPVEDMAALDGLDEGMKGSIWNTG